MLSTTLREFMNGITVHKQNRNQKIFTIMVLWKQLLPKQTETNHTSIVILTWSAHYVFKDNTFIQYPDGRLAFSPPRKRARAASGNKCPARFYELLHPEDRWASHSNFGDLCSAFERKLVLLMKAALVPNFSTIQWAQKLKSKFFFNYFQNHFPLSSLCPSFSVAQDILLLPTISSLLLTPFSQ